MVTVRTTTRTDDDTFRQSVTIEVLVDGKSELALSFNDGEPEDNCIARNFSGLCFLDRIIKKVLFYAKAGHSVEFEDIGE